LVTTIAKVGFGDDEDKARDILGRTYEYFIKRFAAAEGHRGGEFYTPQSVTRLLIEMLEPYEGRVLDPACGSCGLFIQSANFVKSHGGKSRKISIHGLSGDIRLGDSLLDDQHPGLKADFVLANPPFNEKKWGTQQVADDSRWKFGTPPDSNANYAWIQNFIHHLAPDGRAGFVMANGSLTSNQSGEGQIREAIVREDLVDCIVACPGKLFYTTPIPVSLWLLDRNKQSGSERDRRGEVLFIDARQMGNKISRTQIEFTAAEIQRIADTYHAWRGTKEEKYGDEKGFCASVSFDEIEKHGFELPPGRFVGAPESEEDEIEFEEKMAGLVDRLADELAESERLAAEVKKALGAAGYEL
jgi:type I restriction enzyme M protein